MRQRRTAVCVRATLLPVIVAAKRPKGGEDLADALQALFADYIGSPTKLQRYGPRLERRVLAQNRGLIIRVTMQRNLAFQPLMVKKSLASVAGAMKTTSKYGLEM